MSNQVPMTLLLRTILEGLIVTFYCW